MKRLVNVDLNNNKITNLSDGSSSGDAVNKGQLDDVQVVAMGYVYHGATAGTSRPTGYAAITWVGIVEPTNATNNDIWHDIS